MTPTRSSRKRKGIGTIYATRAAMDTNRTSPAKTLPKRRKESEAILANSPIISISPTKNLIGATIITVGSLLTLEKIPPSAFRLTYLLKVFHKPMDTIPKMFAPTTAVTARAMVVLMSAVPPRRKGIKARPCSPRSISPNPPSGTIPSQLLIRMKKKTEMAMGKIFTDRAPLFVTWSHHLCPSSTTTSKRFCNLPGMALSFEHRASERIIMMTTTAQLVSKALVILKFPTWYTGSAKRVISWLISSWTSSTVFDSCVAILIILIVFIFIFLFHLFHISAYHPHDAESGYYESC